MLYGELLVERSVVRGEYVGVTSERCERVEVESFLVRMGLKGG